jgi:hypothetical protein
MRVSLANLYKPAISVDLQGHCLLDRVLAVTRHLVPMFHSLTGCYLFGQQMWLVIVLATKMEESREIAVNEDDIPREVNVDTDLVIQLVERLGSTSENM